MNEILGPILGLFGGVLMLLMSEFYIRSNRSLARTDAGSPR